MTDVPESPSEAAAPPQPGLRFLEAAVYIMGGLLILMLVILIGGVAWKASHRSDAAPEGPKLLDLGLSTPASLEQMVLDGDHLALRTASEIVVIDIRKGTILARVKLGGSPP